MRGRPLDENSIYLEKKQDLLFPIFFWPSVNLDLEKLNIKWRWGDGEEKKEKGEGEEKERRGKVNTDLSLAILVSHHDPPLSNA